MTDYTELKRLAEAAMPSEDSPHLPCTVAFDRAASPAVILAMIAELENFKAEIPKWTEREIKLIADNQQVRMHIKELDLLFGRYLLGMRSAVIELEHGQGAEAAMRWIVNGLIGPGQLPPEDETDAQAYFDREIVAVNQGMEEVLAFHDARRVAKEASNA